jgi:hypothetical protein
MSLFQCEICGCVENTACSNYYWDKSNGDLGRCSACDPDFGKWHGRFARTFLPIGMFQTAKNGNLEHKETGEQDYHKYEVINT